MYESLFGVSEPVGLDVEPWPDADDLGALSGVEPYSDAEMERIAALDLSYDPAEPLRGVGERIPERVLLVDPDLPEYADSRPWWGQAASLTPTGYLLDALEQAPFNALDAEQALQVTVAAERLAAKAVAIQLRAIGRFAALRRCGPDASGSSWAPRLDRYAPDELGCAMAISRRAAGQRLRLAHRLTDVLPGTLAGLQAGRIDAGKARVIAERTGPLDPAQARAVEQHVLARAGQQTHPQLRAAVDRAVIRADPAAAAARCAEQVAQREVRLDPLGDGVSELSARLPAELAAACYDRISQLARTAATADDPRNSDQRRADVLCDLLLGTATGGGVQAQILVLTRETSLLRLDDEPGELIGTGPLPAQVVRRIAEQHPNSIWRRLLTDPTSGAVTDLGRTRYRPTAGLDEFVRLRTLTCYFPGCRKPATRCDYNHLKPFTKGGHTNQANAGPACRHHHQMTDRPNPTWTVAQPEPGSYQITSPTGRKYRSHPQPLLEPPQPRPEPDHEPAPF